MSNEWREQAINQAQEQRLVADVKIAQKLGLAHREAFRTKYPGQVEHILRLIAERLQQGLRKDTEVLSPEDTAHLAQALCAVNGIYKELNSDQQ
jgi:hypothetical protein